MNKTMYFNSKYARRWPAAGEIEAAFLAPKGKEWFNSTGNDTGGFSLEGVDGTEHLQWGDGRVDIKLDLWGRPGLGVMIIYSKTGGPGGYAYTSKGDQTRMKEYVRSLHDTPLPVGLFIPFPEAWKAVKEFIESDGQLPKSIAWIKNTDLAPDTFPDP